MRAAPASGPASPAAPAAAGSPQPPGLRELRPSEGSAKTACLGLRLPLPRAAAPAAPRWDNAASDSLAARVPFSSLSSLPQRARSRVSSQRREGGEILRSPPSALRNANEPPPSVPQPRPSRRLLTGSAGHKMGLPLPWAPPFCEKPPRSLAAAAASVAAAAVAQARRSGGRGLCNG